MKKTNHTAREFERCQICSRGLTRRDTRNRGICSACAPPFAQTTIRRTRRWNSKLHRFEKASVAIDTTQKMFD